MSKLKLIGFLLFWLFTLKGQNNPTTKQLITPTLIEWENNDSLEWHAYNCGDIVDTEKIVGTNTLIVSPNPFDSITVIQFTISHNDTIWLNVFSSTGNTVKTYYNGAILSSGTYSYTFNGDTLPNGIYFVSLKVNAITQTVKIIKGLNEVGLKESHSSKDLLVFPNPATSIINLSIEQGEFTNSSIEITNALGKVFLNIPFHNQINISDLSSGIYFLTIQNDTSNKTVKILKQ